MFCQWQPIVSTFFAATLLMLAVASAANAANAEGQLDPHFNGTGQKTVRFYVGASAISARADAIALQADGKTVVAGSFLGNGGITGIALTRLNADGSIDTGFGSPGSGSTGRREFALPGYQLSTVGVAVQSDGKIVVAGDIGDGSGWGNFFVARFTADGAYLDPGFGFGSSGYNLVGFGADNDAALHAMALGSDGSIYLAGDTFNDAGNMDFALAKLTPDGTLDPNYGSSGKATFGFDQGGGKFDIATAMTLQSDGKLVLVGRVDSAFGENVFGVLRVDSSGHADGSFGTLSGHPGMSVISFHNVGAQCYDRPSAVQTWKPFLGSRVIYVAGTHCFNQTTSTGAVAAFNDDGTLDSSFNGGGTYVNFNSSYNDQTVTALVLQPAPASPASFLLAPKLIVVGYGDSIQWNSNVDMLMTRLNPDATLDTSFGKNGDQLVYFNQIGGGLGDDGAKSAAMLGNGYLVVAGYSQYQTSPNAHEFAVTRLLVGDGIFHDGFEPVL